MLKFTWLNRPLDYEVRRHGKVVIPKGAEGVRIAFGAANWTYLDEEGRERRGNLYLYKNKIY